MVKDAARRDQDAENIIADPSAELPDDWEVEEDGEWEAPKVPNPACAAKGPLDAGGCEHVREDDYLAVLRGAAVRNDSG